MGTSVRRPAGLAASGIGLAFLLIAGHGAAADAKSGAVYKPVMPRDVFTQVVTEDGKALKDAVAKASDKKQASKARSVALLIAVYAQQEANRGGDKAAHLVGMRDAALKLAKAIADNKLDEAKKLAAEITPNGSAAPSGTSGTIAVHEDFEIDTLMQVFKPERGGGLEWEKKLQTLVNKRSAYTPAEYKQIVPLAYRVAAIAQPTEAFAPAPMGKKTPAEWIKYSQEMGKEAVDAAELAAKAKPDDKAVKAALKKIDATCTNCHDKYRDTK
jgi:Cytochrome C'